MGENATKAIDEALSAITTIFGVDDTSTLGTGSVYSQEMISAAKIGPNQFHQNIRYPLSLR